MAALRTALSFPTPYFLKKEMQAFTTIWFGQFISLFGSGLTSFALGLWVLQKSGSVTQYALIALAALVPRVLVSPVSGALVDRWDRRRTMLLSDLGAGLCSLALAGLLLAGRLEVWQVYLAVGIASVFGSFQSTAYMASVSLLVPGSNLGRANGLLQLRESVCDLFTPLVAGFLLAAIKIQGVILIDFITFLAAVATLLVVPIPRPPATAQSAALKKDSGLSTLLLESGEGWHFISRHSGLVGVLVIMAIFNFQWGMVGVLAAPLVLGFSDPRGLGILFSVAGGGMLTGSLVMSRWGGPRRRIVGILLFELISGVCFITIGLRPSLLIAGLGAFGAHLTIAVIAGSNRALWQRKVAPQMQGRVFAIQEMVAKSAVPLAILIAGPLAERLFNPLMAPGGALASSLGSVLGVGPERGIALIFVLMGLVQAAVATGGALYKPLRTIEDELPDAV